MKKYIETNNIKDKNCVGIVCGANMNFDRLRYIAERTEIGEKKEAIFAVTIPEQTGAFLNFCRRLHGRNITEFNYRADSKKSPDSMEPAAIFVGIALKEGDKERQTISNQLAADGYNAYDLTDDDVAKSHIRLIGGHAHVENEQLLSIVFPERPGALLTFLEKLGDDFNITLFHYRNHGAAEGRVFMRYKKSVESNSRQLQDALLDIGYNCTMLNDNIGYQLFLK